MKQLFINILLLLLVISLVTFFDIIQGLGVAETLHCFLIIKQMFTGEEWFLTFLLIFPLICTKLNKISQKRYSSKSMIEK